MKKHVLLAMVLILFQTKAYGYANFIGHGYTSCLTCHFNPFGGGMLNDYGRGVSATAISSRALYPAKVNDEKLSYISGFLFRPPKQNWLRTQINYRGFSLTNNPGSQSSEKAWITMQKDVRVTLKFGENDRFIFSGDYGEVPQTHQTEAANDTSKYRSRSHYVGYRYSPKLGFYAGLMDKIYGIRVIEHTAYSRMYPQLTQNDQSHGIAMHYLDENWEGGTNIFVGNLSQNPEVRTKGFSGMLERTIFAEHRVGASLQKSTNEFFDLISYAIHGRFSLKDGSAVLTEFGQTSQKTRNQAADIDSRYGLLQTYLRPWRGIYFSTNIEYLKQDVDLEPYTLRFGPGVQYFPAQRLEFRLDLINTRSYLPERAVKDSWLMLLQTHVWL